MAEKGTGDSVKEEWREWYDNIRQDGRSGMTQYEGAIRRMVTSNEGGMKGVSC